MGNTSRWSRTVCARQSSFFQVRASRPPLSYHVSVSALKACRHYEIYGITMALLAAVICHARAALAKGYEHFWVLHQCGRWTHIQADRPSVTIDCTAGTLYLSEGQISKQQGRLVTNFGPLKSWKITAKADSYQVS